MTNSFSTLKRSLLGHEWSFPYNCYEVGHAWTPSCTQAALEVGLSAFRNSVVLYTPLYIFNQFAIQRKYNVDAFSETFKSIITSSSFLSFHFLSGIIITCIIRASSDRYYYRLLLFWPAFISSAMSLLIERESRRPALAFYLVNLSSEILYRLVVARGYMVPIPHGETLLFSLGLCGWFYFLRINGFGHDPVSFAFKMLIGPHEAKSRSTKQRQISEEINDQQSIQQKNSEVNIASRISRLMNQFFDKHPSCGHKNSCVEYAVEPWPVRFLIGWSVSSALSLAGSHRQLLSHPGDTIWKALASDKSIRFGLFLSSFVSLTRSTYCCLRRYSGRQENWHGIVSGAIAGTSMLFSPKGSIATYVIWKCLEQFYFQAAKEGRVKYVNQTVVVAYSMSVALLLYTFALEPRFIRPSYMKFIDQISDHRLHQLNRLVLDVFGTGASIGYEDWFPNLDPKFMTRQFQEIIFDWLIQPH